MSRVSSGAVDEHESHGDLVGELTCPTAEPARCDKDPPSRLRALQSTHERLHLRTLHGGLPVVSLRLDSNLVQAQRILANDAVKPGVTWPARVCQQGFLAAVTHGLQQTAAGAFAVSDAAGLVGPHGDFDAVSGAELSHEAGEVGFDGARGDVELAGDLIVGAALGYRHEDFLLAGGERFYRLPRW